MTPKFRGGSDDWDNDDRERGVHASRGAKPKKSKPKTGYIDPALTNGTVCEVFPNQCLVIRDAGGKMNCTYRKAKLPTVEIRERAPVAVGDRVRVEAVSNTDGVIDGVGERKNMLSRPAPERAMRHVLVANIERLAVVASAHDPDFSPGLVDRFLIAALAQEIEPVLLITKMDLQKKDDPSPWTHYRALGYQVFEVCVVSGLGVSEVREFLKGKLTTFCGHSGVGKTSLLNALLGREVGRVGEISSSTGKGQHTTTGAYLLPESKLIDTPGIREFGLMGIEANDLAQYFPEFRGLQCSDPHCIHREEEGCAAKELIRYSSYRRILESLAAGEH